MKILEKIKNIIFVLALAIAWVFNISKLLSYINQDYLLGSLFYSCLCAPLFEELIFRHIPFQTLNLIPFKSEADQTKMIMLVTMMSSFIFGWLHGNGWNSVLIQGFLGLGFCYIYLKNGYSYWSSVLAHLLWNLGVILTKV